MNVRLYVEANCAECDGAKRLLEEREIGYEEIDVTLHPDRRAELNGKHTLPQVFFGDQHVGGLRDLEDLSRTVGLRAALLGHARVP